MIAEGDISGVGVAIGVAVVMLLAIGSALLFLVGCFRKKDEPIKEEFHECRCDKGSECKVKNDRHPCQCRVKDTGHHH